MGIDPHVVVQLPDGAKTFKNKDGSLWSERFEDCRHFEEGLAVVKLKDGWTFVDENHNIWPERFSAVDSFSEGLASVELKDGWTYVDKNRNVWPERYGRTYPFSEGYGLVDLGAMDSIVGGPVTFIDKKHNLWSERFKDAGFFKDGMAAVRLDDGWTFINKDHQLLNVRSKSIYGDFDNGLAKVNYSDGKYQYVDKEGRMFSSEDGKVLYSIHKKPEEFLILPTEKFKDDNFIAGAVFQVKDALLEPVENKEEINDEYVTYCTELLTSCKEKTEQERAKIKEDEKTAEENKAKKENLINSIKSFEI